MHNDSFYTDLPELDLPVTQLREDVHFHHLPSNWWVIISDIKNSTIAVNQGRHNEVNLVAAGSLVACINIAGKYGIELPFYFGGDGGTILIPPDIIDEVLQALYAYNTNAKTNFGLEMHIGSVAVRDILSSRHSLLIAKLSMPNGLTKPVIIGDGLQYAEQVVKQGRKEQPAEDFALVDLEGLECRWDKIKPPKEENEVVCFLVEARDPARQMPVYRDVLLTMENIYGNVQNRHPLTFSKMKLVLGFSKLRNEMMVRYGRLKFFRMIRIFIETLTGALALKFNWKVGSFHARDYVKEVIENTDTLNIDGRLTTVISGNKANRLAMLKYLQEKEAAGELIFGHHASGESIITCYIEDRSKKHIHFLDGADGGYTSASKEFKRKKQSSQTINSAEHQLAHT